MVAGPDSLALSGGMIARKWRHVNHFDRPGLYLCCFSCFIAVNRRKMKFSELKPANSLLTDASGGGKMHPISQQSDAEAKYPGTRTSKRAADDGSAV